VGIEAGWSAPHRVQLVRLGDVTLSTTRTTPPRSVEAARQLLRTCPVRRGSGPGEMLEPRDAHRRAIARFGEAAARTVEWLVVVGEGAAGIADGRRRPASIPQDHPGARR
jgi:hypothetical protein